MADFAVAEALEKYGLEKENPRDYCIAQVRFNTVLVRAVTNDYFDNRLVGQLFFRLIRFFFYNVFWYFIDKKHTTPHSVQCLSNKRANWMIHIQYLTIYYTTYNNKEKTQIF